MFWRKTTKYRMNRAIERAIKKEVRELKSLIWESCRGWRKFRLDGKEVGWMDFAWKNPENGKIQTVPCNDEILRKFYTIEGMLFLEKWPDQLLPTQDEIK